MHYARQVIGYHGCHVEVAQRILNGEPFLPSEKPYDWLGKGVYFWEFGLDRAWRWAASDPKRMQAPRVVGAIIQLGFCFDLLDTNYTTTLSRLASLYVAALRADHQRIPLNRGPSLKARFFDCAVINWTLDELEKNEGASFQTVRGAFLEGQPVFSDGEICSAILMENHIQIAVRDPHCIVGVFRPTMPTYSSR
jgi:hypothetical protein